MKTIDQKLKQCDSLIHILVKIKDINNIPCNRYYFVLKIWQKLRDEKVNVSKETFKIN